MSPSFRLFCTLFLIFCHFSSSLCASETEDLCDEHGNCGEGVNKAPYRRRVAIVGGGIAGSSAAFYISQLLPHVDITIYEKESGGVCGRLQDTVIDGSNVEVGGSIYHASNLNVDRFVHLFNLTKLSPFGGSTLGIWNGTDFVFRGSNVPYVGSLINLGYMFWRYGWAPYNLKTYLDGMMSNWSKLYTMEEPFETVDSFFEGLGLRDEATTTAPELLERHGISRDFTKEIIGSMTRVNYNTDVSIMNAFGAAVSAIGSGDDIFGVKEGNKYLCTNLVSASKAEHKGGHKVTSILRDKRATRYTVSSETGEGIFERSFDAVVIATPLELSTIEFENIDVDASVFNSRKYQEVHVTFVAGTLNPNYFGMPNGTAPTVVLTVEDSSIPFSSIGRSKNITKDGKPVSKVFSRTPLTQETISEVFINGTIAYSKSIFAYPILTPPNPFIPIKLDEQVYYVNAMESVVSTIETETISAKNIARLLAKSWGQPYKQEI